MPPGAFSSAAPLPPDATNGVVRTSSTPTSLPTRGKDPWAETTTGGPTPLSRSAKGRLKKAGSFRERKNPRMGNLRVVGSEEEPGQKSQGSAWSGEANGAAQTPSSSSIKDMIAREAAIERGAVNAARHSATITQEEIEAMQRVFERAAVANEVQLVSAAMNQSATQWWREKSITIGMHVAHPVRGRGKVVNINPDGDGRVHVEFVGGKVFPYFVTSWKAMATVPTGKAAPAPVSVKRRKRRASLVEVVGRGLNLASASSTPSASSVREPSTPAAVRRRFGGTPLVTPKQRLSKAGSFRMSHSKPHIAMEILSSIEANAPPAKDPSPSPRPKSILGGRRRISLSSEGGASPGSPSSGEGAGTGSGDRSLSESEILRMADAAVETLGHRGAAPPASAPIVPPAPRGGNRRRRNSIEALVSAEGASTNVLSAVSGVVAAPTARRPRQRRTSLNDSSAFLGGSSQEQQRFFEDDDEGKESAQDTDSAGAAAVESVEVQIARQQIYRSIMYLQPLPAITFLVMVPQLLLSQSVWLWTAVGAATAVNELIVLVPLLRLPSLRTSSGSTGTLHWQISLTFLLLSLTLNVAELASSFLGASWSAQALLLAYFSTFASDLPKRQVGGTSILMLTAYAAATVPLYRSIGGDGYASYHAWHLDGGGVGLQANACYPEVCAPELRMGRASVLAAMWLTLLFPTLLLRKENTRLEELIAMGEAQDQQMISPEEERAAERILNNILPPSINKLLMEHPGRTIAHEFSACSMMFGYIGGLQTLKMEVSRGGDGGEGSEDNEMHELTLRSITALERLDVLNQLVSKIDDLTETFELEKIKTIGECYMVASGLPIPSHNHAKNLAHFALAFRTTVADFQETLHFYGIQAELYVKIGLATGRAVAGVIGRRKFTYDVFGDTVNVSSRMYSNAPKGEIMMSPQMKNALRSHRQFVIKPHPKGMIPIKGKGNMATYLLKGLQDPSLILETPKSLLDAPAINTPGPSVTAVVMDGDSNEDEDEQGGSSSGRRGRRSRRTTLRSAASKIIRRKSSTSGIGLGKAGAKFAGTVSAAVTAAAVVSPPLPEPEASPLVYTDNPSIRNAIASRLHEMWRDDTRLQPDGSYLPRIKVVTDPKSGEERTYDIANLTFNELPESFQESNTNSAHCACRAVENGYRYKEDLKSRDFLERASEVQHDQWSDNNKEWADPSLLVPYDELSEPEKEKDRKIVRIALEEYKNYLFMLYHEGDALAFGFDKASFGYELARLGEQLRLDGTLPPEADLLEVDISLLVGHMSTMNPALRRVSALLSHISTTLSIKKTLEKKAAKTSLRGGRSVSPARQRNGKRRQRGGRSAALGFQTTEAFSGDPMDDADKTGPMPPMAAGPPPPTMTGAAPPNSVSAGPLPPASSAPKRKVTRRHSDSSMPRMHDFRAEIKNKKKALSVDTGEVTDKTEVGLERLAGRGSRAASPTYASGRGMSPTYVSPCPSPEANQKTRGSSRLKRVSPLSEVSLSELNEELSPTTKGSRQRRDNSEFGGGDKKLGDEEGDKVKVKEDACILSKATLDDEDQTVEIVFVSPIKAICLGHCCHELAWCCCGRAVLSDDSAEELKRVEDGFDRWHIERSKVFQLKVWLLALFALQVCLHVFNSATLARIAIPKSAFWGNDAEDRTEDEMNETYVYHSRLQHIGSWITVGIMCPSMLVCVAYLLSYDWAVATKTGDAAANKEGDDTDAFSGSLVVEVSFDERIRARFVKFVRNFLPNPWVFNFTAQISVLTVGVALIAQAAVVDLWISFVVLAYVYCPSPSLYSLLHRSVTSHIPPLALIRALYCLLLSADGSTS